MGDSGDGPSPWPVSLLELCYPAALPECTNGLQRRFASAVLADRLAPNLAEGTGGIAVSSEEREEEKARTENTVRHRHRTNSRGRVGGPPKRSHP